MLEPMTTTDAQPSPNTTNDTSSLQSLIDGYFECWNTTDNEAQAAAVARTWTDDAISSDPLNRVTGHDELLAMFRGTQEAYPGHRFEQVGGSDGHHDLVRWGWRMVDPSGETMLDGIDAAVVGADGRITYLAGFFGAEIPQTES